MRHHCLRAMFVLDVGLSDRLSKVTIRNSSSIWRRWCDTVCGLPADDSVPSRDVTELTDAERRTLVDEKLFWKNFLTINAVIALVIVAFLCGFFK